MYNRHDLIKRARALRRNQTEAERRLWARLCNRQIAGAKFRRQLPVGPYIADFACWELGLIIEVDGGQHADNRRDDVRTAVLNKQGFRVIRFWNSEIFEDLDGVLETIRLEILNCTRCGKTEK